MARSGTRRLAIAIAGLANAVDDRVLDGYVGTYGLGQPVHVMESGDQRRAAKRRKQGARSAGATASVGERVS